MMGWADGYGWMGPGWIFMILFWVLVLVGVDLSPENYATDKRTDSGSGFLTR